MTVGSIPALAQTRKGVRGWSNIQIADSIAEATQGQKLAHAKCAGCHGEDGNSSNPQIPKLAGQNPAYLYRQLWAFRQGTRESDMMSGIVATITDVDMADAASFYSLQLRKSRP